jgi:hypothetical protein
MKQISTVIILSTALVTAGLLAISSMSTTALAKFNCSTSGSTSTCSGGVGGSIGSSSGGGKGVHTTVDCTSGVCTSTSSGGSGGGGSGQGGGSGGQIICSGKGQCTTIHGGSGGKP